MIKHVRFILLLLTYSVCHLLILSVSTAVILVSRKRPTTMTKGHAAGIGPSLGLTLSELRASHIQAEV